MYKIPVATRVQSVHEGDVLYKQQRARVVGRYHADDWENGADKEVYHELNKIMGHRWGVEIEDGGLTYEPPVFEKRIETFVRGLGEYESRLEYVKDPKKPWLSDEQINYNWQRLFRNIKDDHDKDYRKHKKRLEKEAQVLSRRNRLDLVETNIVFTEDTIRDLKRSKPGILSRIKKNAISRKGCNDKVHLMRLSWDKPSCTLTFSPVDDPDGDLTFNLFMYTRDGDLPESCTFIMPIENIKRSKQNPGLFDVLIKGAELRMGIAFDEEGTPSDIVFREYDKPTRDNVLREFRRNVSNNPNDVDERIRSNVNFHVWTDIDSFVKEMFNARAVR